MKSCRAAQISILVLVSATTTFTAKAQMAPAEGVGSSDLAKAPPSSKPLYPSPISSYALPNEKEKLRLFAFDAFGPYAFGIAALAGGYQQATKAPPEWGVGAGAFGERVASNFGIQMVTTATRYGMAEALREDTAYYPCDCAGLFRRFRHAVVSTITARHGSYGHTTFSVSGLVAPYAGTMTALAWYPNRYGVKDGFRMGNYNLAGQAVENLALEFIYGGPHSLFKHINSFKPPGGSAADQNP